MRQILITGTSRGLGFELLKSFVNDENIVYAIIRNADSKKKLQLLFGNKCIPIIADVEKDNCSRIIQKVLSNHTSHLDILINNAGITGISHHINDVSSTEILKLFNVHCVGVIRTVKSCVNYLNNSSNPKIINISSRLGSLTNNAFGEYNNLNISYSYRIAKAAQNMLSICLSNELKHNNIITCSIHPGKIKTQSGLDDADLEPHDAANYIISIIDNLTMKDTGKFYNFDKREINW